MKKNWSINKNKLKKLRNWKLNNKIKLTNI